MRSIVLAVSAVQAACQGGTPGSGSAPSGVTPGAEAGPAIATTFVGCAIAAPAPRGRIVRTPPASEPAFAVTAWTPYAQRVSAPEDIAKPVVLAARTAIAAKLGEIDLCLTDKNGSVTALLDVAVNGSVTARVGGIGHRPTESCIARVLQGVTVPAPAQPVELECGFGIGAAGPLRVTSEAGSGYEVVEVTPKAVRHGGGGADLVDGKVTLPPPPAGRAVLVIADPDVPAPVLQTVLAWAGPTAAAVLVAVKADGGPPVFVAMAPDARATTAPAHALALRVDGGNLLACAGTAREPGVSLVDARAIDAMMKRALAACGQGGGTSCDEVAPIGPDGDHVAKQLIAATSAARRAGLDPVLASERVCY